MIYIVNTNVASSNPHSGIVMVTTYYSAIETSGIPYELGSIISVVASLIVLFSYHSHEIGAIK